MVLSNRMFAALSAFYPSQCTVQEYVEVQLGSGHPEKVWSDLAGHDGLPCRFCPSSGNEVKSSEQIYSMTSCVVELTGPYPAITTKNRVIIDDGVVYNIIAVQRDGQGASCKLVVEKVS